ncbi:MAG: hypothetical protein ABI759_26735 [Candidatus Solibacter sp.]
MKNTLYSLVIAVSLAAGLPAQVGFYNNFDIALLGDMPYGTAREAAYERLINDVNEYHPLFAVHIGDTKSGSTLCEDTQAVKTMGYFRRFQVPLLYSIGDNEWTDCMRTNNGAYDPLGRLELIRRTFFSTNDSLGNTTVPLMRQSDDPAYKLYRENAMLVAGTATFVTIHMPGSNNNLEYKTVQGAPNRFYDNDVEYRARNAANVAWLHAAFRTAKDNRSSGVMIFSQANVFESFTNPGIGATHSGFADFVTALREETQKFDGQVVMVSGDSHYMRMDKPLTKTYPGCVSAQGDCTAVATPSESPGDRIYNFTRVEVPGDGDVHWIVAHVRLNRQNPFSFEFRLVPGN